MDAKAVDLLGVDYVKELEQQKGKPFCQLVGNQLYAMAETIEMDQIARDVFSGKVVEMGEEEKKQFEFAVSNVNWIGILRRSVLNSIEKIQE